MFEPDGYFEGRLPDPGFISFHNLNTALGNRRPPPNAIDIIIAS
jgi:hypothetical protein